MICKYWSDTSLYILFVNIFRIMHYRALINSVNGKRAEKFPVVPGGHVGIIMLKFYCQSYYYKEKWSCIESQETLWFLGGQNSAWKEPRVEYIYIYIFMYVYMCISKYIYIYMLWINVARVSCDVGTKLATGSSCSVLLCWSLANSRKVCWFWVW